MNDDIYDIGQYDPKTGKRWSGENYGWQSEESHNKLFVAGKLNPTEQAINRFGNYIYTSAQQDPIIGPAMRFIGGAAKTVMEATPEPIQQAVGFALAKNQEAAENIAAATGLPVTLTDPMTIADVVTGGATLATRPAIKTAVKETIDAAATIRRNLPPPPAPRLATVGDSQITIRNGQVKFNSNVMEAVTATDPDILSVTGRKTGETIVDSAQQKLLVKRNLEVQKYQNKLVSLREELTLATEQGANKKVLDDIRDKIGDAEEMLSRRQSNVLVPDSDDPLWYKTSNSKKAKKLEQIRRQMVGTYLEEHHIFPKGMSAAFFNRMDELIASGVAEADDLLLMAEYASKSGVKAGDVRSNLVNLMKDPHNELHQVLRAQGDEIGKQQWQKILTEANTVDELLGLWKDVIGRNVIPNAETARIWQPLDDLVKEIQSK